mgnify:CR=1 FL=1
MATALLPADHGTLDTGLHCICAATAATRMASCISQNLADSLTLPRRWQCRGGRKYSLARTRTYRSRQSAAMALARALEDQHGIPVTRSTPPVDIVGLAAALAAGYVPDNN